VRRSYFEISEIYADGNNVITGGRWFECIGDISRQETMLLLLAGIVCANTPSVPSIQRHQRVSNIGGTAVSSPNPTTKRFRCSI